MKVEITRRAEKDIRRLEKADQERILKALSKLESGPLLGDIRKLKSVTPETWRLRVGNFRIFFRIDAGKQTIYVMHISHRKDAYT